MKSLLFQLLAFLLSAFLFLALSRSIYLWFPLDIKKNKLIMIEIYFKKINKIFLINNKLNNIKMQKIVNIINFSGWLFLIFHVGIPMFWDPKAFLTSDISLDVTVLQFIQTFQIMDIILILIGKSKGSILGATFQILGRMIVALGFAEPSSNPLKFATVALIWALADCNRYLYYLFKNHPITAALRYNSFIVLYPIGVFGQMLLINDYMYRHITELSQSLILLIRVIQAGIVIGLIFLYIYMLKMRSKYYAKTGGFFNSFNKLRATSQNNESKSSQESSPRSRSPRAKRD